MAKMNITDTFRFRTFVRHEEVLFGVCYPGLCSKATLKGIAWAPNPDVPRSDTATAIVELTWNFARNFHFVDVMLCVMFVWVLMELSWRVRQGSLQASETADTDDHAWVTTSTSITLFFCLLLKEVLDEIVKIIVSARRYVASPLTMFAMKLDKVCSTQG